MEKDQSTLLLRSNLKLVKVVLTERAKRDMESNEDPYSTNLCSQVSTDRQHYPNTERHNRQDILPKTHQITNPDMIHNLIRIEQTHITKKW